jgi:CRP/FNR family transcriptional regulator
MKVCFPTIDANRKSYKVNKGELLFQEGEKVSGIYFVNTASVKVNKKWGDKELIVRFAKNSDIVGHRGLGYDDYFPISATAPEPTIICFFELEFFSGFAESKS